MTIRNDYHGTEVKVRPQYVPTSTGPCGALTARQVSRVRRALCASKGCTCGGLLNERGAQTWRGAVSPLPGGGVLIELDTQ